MPGDVTPAYLAATLNMSPVSASGNVLPSLRTFGLVNDAGKPTDLAFAWRDDEKYASVCEQLVKSTYPAGLHDAFPDVANAPMNRVAAWFAHDTKAGDSAAVKYARVYLMLLEGDLGKANEKPARGTATGRVATTPRTTPKAAKVTVAPAAMANPEPGEHDHQQRQPPPVGSAFSPKLHIDVQIHISPESSAEQIDKIFESMAKHLKDFRS
ncbi:DUF5343 domain-containing protein [Burkholderia cenocepacia]|uniref:DUF5343 domain-containing protein n=1 Tax=Burkholderia cenocepacia TaxID=95486 RepID=UPI001CF5532F|nr:DUF5343 domain-containing protein [Burkholderia cenocepacia]